MKQKLLKFFKRMLIAYCIIGVLLYIFQEQLLLRPTSLTSDYKYNFNTSFKEINISYNSTTKFNLIQFLPNSSLSIYPPLSTLSDTFIAKGVVLYFHGNKENINHYAVYASNFTKHGYEVWICDYPTFGKSTGKLNEEILYQEALEVYKLASKKFKLNNIVIYGRSFGTGIAAQLASTQPCKRLILETPYYSIVSLEKRYAFIYPIEAFSKYKLPTYEYCKNITVPISIFHGTDDGVIPYSNAAKLKIVMKPLDEFITIKNGSHNNLNDFPLFHHKLDSLLAY